MKILIKEVSCCSECPYSYSGSGKYNCSYKRWGDAATGLPPDLIHANCPLDKVEGSENRMIMEEIRNCNRCPYFVSPSSAPCEVSGRTVSFIARNGVHHSCVLEDILPESKL